MVLICTNRMNDMDNKKNFRKVGMVQVIQFRCYLIVFLYLMPNKNVYGLIQSVNACESPWLKHMA